MKSSPCTWAVLLPVALTVLLAAIAPDSRAYKPLVLKFQYRSYILLQGKINQKHDAKLLLDTGADELLLDEEYFNSTGIIINQSQLAQLPGAGATPQTITVVLDRMQVNFDTLSYIPRYVPLMDLRSIVGEKADGVIGAGFLRPYLTEIDFKNEQMTLHTDRSILTDFDSIQLDLRNNRYYLPLSIEAADGLVINGSFQLDLGNGGAVIITSPTAHKYALASKIQHKLKYFNVSGGVGGRTEGYQFRAKSLTIGQTRLLLPHIDWSSDSEGALARPNYDGLLGNTILERFSVILDFQKNMLYLKPLPSVSDPFVSTITGMSTVKKSKAFMAAIVTGLYQGGNAEKAGILVGDKIIAVNGTRVAEMEDGHYSALLRKPGKPLELELLREGQSIMIQLPMIEIL